MDDHILNGGHGDFKKVGIGSVGEMPINFSCRTSIQSHEFIHKVFTCLLPALGISLEIRESVFGNWTVDDFLLEEIDLVEKENESRVFEPM